MLFVLRCIGIVNAAIWFGAAFFSCVVLAPAFASDQIVAILPSSHSGRAFQIVMERSYLLHFWCGGIALAQLLAEWLYTGRPFRTWSVYLILGLSAFVLAAGFWLEPKVKKLHLDRYGMRSTPQQREQARVPLKVWQDVSEIWQYLLTIGLFVHLLQAASPGSPPRFLGVNKFQG